MSKCDLCLSGCVGGKHLVEYGQSKHVCVSCARHEKIAESKSSSRKVTFHLSEDEESEGEDVEEIFGGRSQPPPQPEAKSSFEKRQEKVSMWVVILQHEDFQMRAYFFFPFTLV